MNAPGISRAKNVSDPQINCDERFDSKQHCGRAVPVLAKGISPFLSQARGSLVEVETQLLIAKELKYLSLTSANELLSSTDELGRILNGLVSSIRERAEVH
jgi:hypothetical protein